MAVAKTKPIMTDCELQHCLPQIYKVLLSASCLSCPSDPIQFLKNTLLAFQGHDNLQDVDWHKFVANLQQHTATTTSLIHRPVDMGFVEPDEEMPPFCLLEKAYGYYMKNLTSCCFRKWKRFTVQSKRDTAELALKMDMSKKHFERKCQQVALTKWLNWVKSHKKTRLKLDSIAVSNKDQQSGEGSDRLSMLPSSLALKIFQYLELRDWLNCAEVCDSWKAIIQSGTLWAQDLVIQRIVEGCPCLLYLNLSCTHVTNKTLRELSRNCVNLQYLSLAYCYKFTDKGFQYLTTGKGCHNLIHLNLSGCTQALLSRCRCLSAMSLLDARHLSDVAFKAIAEVARLKTLSIEGNSQLSNCSWKALCNSSPGLSRLHAAECPRMTDTCLKSVATLRNLQYLDISVCNKVTDVGIKYLTEGPSANKLRELNVSQCSHITNVSVMRIAQSYCERLTEMSLEWLSGSSICSLDISGCDIQDQGLAAAEGLRLRDLILVECVHITDIGIEKLCKSVRDLEHVDVSHCVVLSDPAIRAISFYCTGLITLRMSGCPKMTDMAVQYLTTGSRYLRELDVSGCVLLTDRTLRLLERICPPLSSITMVCCSGISKVAALKLQPRVKHWEHSNDYPPYWFGYNVGQIEHRLTRPIITDDTCAVDTLTAFDRRSQIYRQAAVHPLSGDMKFFALIIVVDPEVIQIRRLLFCVCSVDSDEGPGLTARVHCFRGCFTATCVGDCAWSELQTDREVCSGHRGVTRDLG
ncbi:hypothetical protein INR49_021546, partial [Caranx melampygus]